MSRIYFHSSSGRAEVSGCERGMMGLVCANLASSVLDFKHNGDILKPHFRGPSYLDSISGGEWSDAASTSFQIGWNNVRIEIDGKSIESFALQLNTAISIGNDVVKLMARLHGQCEVHAWVDGPNRKWLAGIIKTGLNTGLFRRDMGWEDVVKLLLKSDSSPIVTSYSACDQFPNSAVASWSKYKDDEKNQESWDKLPKKKRWELGVEGLRKGGGSLEMKPDDWNNFYFGDWNVNAFQIMSLIREKSKK